LRREFAVCGISDDPARDELRLAVAGGLESPDVNFDLVVDVGYERPGNFSIPGYEAPRQVSEEHPDEIPVARPARAHFMDTVDPV